MLLEGPSLVTLPGRTRVPATVLLALLVVGVSWARLPLERLPSHTRGSAPTRAGLLLTDDARAVLAEIAMLPPDSLVAAAPGFAELVPALAGRPVLSFSDRGTVVFAGNRREAERRMRGSAALLGLGGASRHMRNRIVAAHGITHSVVDGGKCDRRSVEVARAGTLRVCAERQRARPGRTGSRYLPLSTAAAGAPRGDSVAVLAGERSAATIRFDCRPAPHRRRRQRPGGRGPEVEAPATLVGAAGGRGLRGETA